MGIEAKPPAIVDRLGRFHRLHGPSCLGMELLQETSPGGDAGIILVDWVGVPVLLSEKPMVKAQIDFP